MPSPIVVWPSMTDDAPILQFLPMRTCGPTTANAPMTVPAPTTAVGETFAVGIDVRDRLDREQQLGLHDRLPVDFRDCQRFHQRTARGAERDHELQLVAGDDVLAELGAVNAAQLHAETVAAAAVDRSSRDRATAALPPAPAPRS